MRYIYSQVLHSSWLHINVIVLPSKPLLYEKKLTDFSQEAKPSSYDYDEEDGIKLGAVASARHNESDNNDEPFWKPAGVEKELKKQLKDVIISPEGLL